MTSIVFENSWSNVTLEWKPLTPTAKGPQKAHAEDAAWDLFADCPEHNIIIDPGKTVIVPTGLAIMHRQVGAATFVVVVE